MGNKERLNQPSEQPKRSSPILETIVRLQVENQFLRSDIQERDEQDELRKERNREAEARYRQKDPEAYRAKKRGEMRDRYWAKKKQDEDFVEKPTSQSNS